MCVCVCVYLKFTHSPFSSLSIFGIFSFALIFIARTCEIYSAGKVFDFLTLDSFRQGRFPQNLPRDKRVKRAASNFIFP